MHINKIINFKEDCLFIEENNILIHKIFIKDIDCLFFNINHNEYSFRIIIKNKSKNLYPFNNPYNISYQIKNKKILIEKVKNKEIKVAPNFGWTNLGNGLIDYCTIVKKHFLTIVRMPNESNLKKNNLLALNYGNIDRNFYKIINDDLKTFNLDKELLENNNRKLEKQLFNFGIKGVFILDKKLTFGMGYAITAITIYKSISPNNPTEEEGFPTFISSDTFYSFSKREIKEKIIEFLSTSYSIKSMCH